MLSDSWFSHTFPKNKRKPKKLNINSLEPEWKIKLKNKKTKSIRKKKKQTWATPRSSNNRNKIKQLKNLNFPRQTLTQRDTIFSEEARSEKTNTTTEKNRRRTWICLAEQRGEGHWASEVVEEKGNGKWEMQNPRLVLVLVLVLGFELSLSLSLYNGKDRAFGN